MAFNSGIQGASDGQTSPLQAGMGDAGTPIASAATSAAALVGSALLGPYSGPPATSGPAFTGAPPMRAFGELFYFRIWVIPTTLDAQNPRFNTPIPFKVWQAYLDPNTLEQITGPGRAGLDLDVDEGDLFGALEQRTVNVVITDDAPYSIDATFNFVFDHGAGTLRFLAQLADILPIDSETGIREKLDWLTDILQNYDGTEQRIATRARPRRTLALDLVLLNDADRKRLYDKIYKTMPLSIIVPAYQYQSQLKANTVIGDNKLYCDPVRADLREGENVVLALADGTFFFYRVASVLTDHITISTSFSQVIPKRTTRVMAGPTGRVAEGASLAMQSIAGQSTMTIQLIDPRDTLVYPNYPRDVTLPMWDGLPMLLRNPIADGDTPEAFNAGLQVIDNDTGKPSQYTAWDQRYISGERNYLINWMFNKDELEFWRTFLDYARGQQRAFYTPTYRQDLVPVDPQTSLLAGLVEVIGTEYFTQYFASDTYKHIEIATEEGLIFHATISSVENKGASTVLHFAAPIDGDLTGTTVSRISYLLKCRLGSDSVTITHQNTYSTLNTSLRTVKA